jgi:hypothetical protein
MKKVVKLTESDLTKLVKRVMNESAIFDELKGYYQKCGSSRPNSISNRFADSIYDSIDGIGTDEGRLIQTFSDFKTFNDFCSTRASYYNSYKSDMLEDIDNDVDSDEVWKKLSRIVRDLYYKQSNKKESDLLANAIKCGHKSIEEYKNSGWSCKGSGIVKENLSDRKGDLYSSINKLIDREFDDVESSVIVDVLSDILDNHKGRSHRKKHNIKDISSDDVRRHWNKK